MKTALITTTINVPHVLALYRKYGPDVRFFVAVDKKTPDLNDIAIALSPWLTVTGEQYKCSELIGWNCIQRRNIALLEALKWGAELIVSIDDDNLCLNENYFDDFFKHWWQRVDTKAVDGGKALEISTTLDYLPFNGLKASSPTGWFDVGQLLQPIAPHRGFPYDKLADPVFSSVVDARVGVAAGICLGDPDISAVTRIANAPIVHGVSEVLRSGVVIAPNQTWTVFNTQNTAFIRELAPAMFCPPGLGRFDDIAASLVCQRVMRERNLHVHFGKPFVWQQRNSHDLVKDLKAEVFGMEYLPVMAKYLNETDVIDARESIVEQVRAIYDDLGRSAWFPKQASEAALAFCDDCEKVL